MIRRFFGNFVDKFIIPFANGTTIHGIPLIIAPRLHFLERLFWLMVVLASGSGAITVVLTNWYRYSANPTVVTIQKDFRNWKNMLPSTTGCFLRKTDIEMAEKYINETWKIDSTNAKYDYYLKFIQVVANVSYNTLSDFAPFEKDTELNKVNFLELAAKVHPSLTGTLVTFDTKRKTYWKLIMTEKGICFVVNNKFSDILTFKVKGVSVTKPNVDESLLKCHYLNGLCYARYDSDPQLPIYFYVHSYLDIIHATAYTNLFLGESEELEINYLMEETSSAPVLRQLYPAQRKCRFDNEPISNDVPVYSTTMCYISCRYRIALQLCGCKPFFYHFIDGRNCDISGLLCLAKHAKTFAKQPAEIGCQCPQPCDIVTYLPLKPKITIWKSGYFDQRITFRWGIMHPTTKYRRDIIFGFEDLVVSLGGTLALFLGVSFISFIEIIFFAIEYLIQIIYKEKTNATSKNVEKDKIKSATTKESKRYPKVQYIRIYKANTDNNPLKNVKYIF